MSKMIFKISLLLGWLTVYSLITIITESTLPKPEEDKYLLGDDVGGEDADVVPVVDPSGGAIVVEHTPRQSGKHLKRIHILQ